MPTLRLSGEMGSEGSSRVSTAGGLTRTSMAVETVSAGRALSVTLYVHEIAEGRAPGCRQTRGFPDAKPMPAGSAPPGAGEGIRVRLNAARGRRECHGTVVADAEWRNGRGGQRKGPPH